jgi:hypothetical protein
VQSAQIGRKHAAFYHIETHLAFIQYHKLTNYSFYAGVKRLRKCSTPLSWTLFSMPLPSTANTMTLLWSSAAHYSLSKPVDVLKTVIIVVSLLTGLKKQAPRLKN